ncbi:CLUMA_CG005579, isoform A [Clunio marinus]|uniref:CLUMA_CG005579, isoform A n=1 Tax=Clunio marinus TaxID=568069 RepID=A0A1J1HV92_9DIPT|nr:CLUMA_CG005579, isoform A [Clunio marinus]
MSLPVNSLYSLTWGDYGTSLVSAVQLLRCHGDLVDVTLAAEGRSFEAHKIVLCAASPYLLNLLKNTTCKHPIVMLAGVSASDLEALLEFVYRGEVSVDHSQLPSLLQAAQCLNIQGLAPQTVTHKDDTAYTSIQIHPGLVHQDVKTHILEVGDNMGEELIMQQPQQIQTHHQIVEEILPEQMSDEVTKEVINQFLPQRKRKPRVPKTPNKQNPAKVVKLEPQASGSETITTITNVEPTTEEMIVENKEQVTEIVEQMGEEQVEQPSTGEVKVKVEGKPSKDKSSKPKSKSQSEQPATCPICSATIRQSRNLRRHLELRHFKKRTPKKIKKEMAAAEQLANTSTEILSDNGNGNNTITVTMEPGSDQQTITVNGQQTGQHVLTTNSDGSLSISGLPGHIIGSLGNATIIRTEDGQQIESGQLITTHEPSLRTSTGEVYRVGTTVYHIEERRSDQPRLN